MECCCGVVISDLSKNIKESYQEYYKQKYILAHTEPLLKELGLLKVGAIFKQRLLKFYYKLIKADNLNTPIQLYTNNLKV